MRPKVLPTTQPAPAMPLRVVGTMAVPESVTSHRFVREALANVMLAGQREDSCDRVIGTANTRSVELYGWGANVGRHVDNTGFMYLMPLVVDGSVLYVEHGGEIQEHRLQVGEVIRLWDWAVHWTEDRSYVVAAFYGSCARPDDVVAFQAIERGVQALAEGAYYGAPRVQPPYRVVLEDECWATGDFDQAEIILRADAQRRAQHVLECAKCSEPAQVVDRQWPHFWGGNLCRAHRPAGGAGDGL